MVDIVKRLRDWRNSLTSDEITRAQLVEIVSAVFRAEDEIVRLRELVKIRDEEIRALRRHDYEPAMNFIDKEY